MLFFSKFKQVRRLFYLRNLEIFEIKSSLRSFERSKGQFWLVFLIFKVLEFFLCLFFWSFNRFEGFFMWEVLNIYEI
jgi:hypothetical protein